MAHDMKFKSK